MHKLGTKADTLEALYKNIERFSMWGGGKNSAPIYLYSW